MQEESDLRRCCTAGRQFGSGWGKTAPGAKAWERNHGGNILNPGREIESNEAPPQTDVGPGGPVSTGAENERTTQRCRSAGRARHPGSVRDRPDVPECLRAAVAAGTGSGEFLSVSPGPSVCVQRADGSDQQDVRGISGSVRQTRAGSGDSVSERSTQRRNRRRAPEKIHQAGGRGVHWQGSREDAGLPHRTAAERNNRCNIPLAGPLDRDGQPVLYLLHGPRLRSLLSEVQQLFPLHGQVMHQRA